MQSFRDFINQDDSGLKPGCKVENCNPECEHYGSTGNVLRIVKIIDPHNPENIMGDEVEYECDCDGNNWKKGDVLRKTKDQLKLVESE